MADILLKNKDGEQVLHQNRTSVSLNKSGGGTITFTEGEAQQKTVALSMYENGQPVDQVIQPDQGKVLTQVTVSRPSTLTSPNIKKGIVIGGVTGAYEGTDTSDANAEAGDIWQSKTAYVNGEKKTGTLYSDTIIRVGDTLSALYFSGAVDDVIVAKCIEESISSDLDLPLLLCGSISDDNYLLLHSYVSVVEQGVAYDVDTQLIISQLGMEDPITYSINAASTLGYIDLSGYTLPPVSSVTDLLYFEASTVPRCYGYSELTGGGAFTQMPFKAGDPVYNLNFNVSNQGVEQELQRLFTTLPYMNVDLTTGLHYTRIGFNYLCAAKLSSVPELGKQGYVLYWGYDLTVIYSTTDFNASSIVPGLVVTNPGWQVSSIELTHAPSIPYVPFDPLQFEQWPVVLNSILFIAMPDKFGYPLPMKIGPATGSQTAAIPYGVNPAIDFFNIADSSTYDYSSMCICAFDATATQLTSDIVPLICCGIDNNTVYFTVHDSSHTPTTTADVRFTLSNGTLALTEVYMNGTDISAYISLCTWKITIIKF